VIDWEGEWRSAQRARPPTPGAQEWDGRAPAFARHTEETGYAELLLDLLRPDPSWTVLDVGSGPGTLAVPFARRVAQVTALDFSPAMLDLLRARCTREGVRNVAAVHGAWEDDWGRLGIGPHDLVVASRSLVVSDLRAALERLQATARRAVCLSTLVGDGPRDRRVLEAVGRAHRPGPDYLTVYGLLHQLGVRADVTLIGREEWKVHPSLDEATAELGWMVRGATAEELARLRCWLERSLVPCPGGLRLPEPRTVEWAVIRWSTGRSAASGRWQGLHHPRTPEKERP
jgi:SAM-dependent methyltransferase